MRIAPEPEPTHDDGTRTAAGVDRFVARLRAQRDEHAELLEALTREAVLLDMPPGALDDAMAMHADRVRTLDARIASWGTFADALRATGTPNNVTPLRR